MRGVHEISKMQELLLERGNVFHSKQIKDLCGKWNVLLRYRPAYRAVGNGIVEQNDRTIKRVAERSGVLVQCITKRVRVVTHFRTNLYSNISGNTRVRKGLV